MKLAISVTLSPENLLWLRARVARKRYRSVSDALDHVVAEAREAYPAGEIRSVAGTITIDPGDPDLTTADEAVRALFKDLYDPAATAAPRSRGRGRKSSRRA